MTGEKQVRETRGAPNTTVTATDRTTGFTADEGAYTVEFNWHAMGCPRSVCVALGDQTIRVPLPEGFPRQALAYASKEVVVYDRKQAFKLSSEPGRIPRNVALTLEATAVDVPFTLLCRHDPLLDGNQFKSEWGPGYDFFYSNGNIAFTCYARILRGLEKDIVDGAACRPEGRWHSVLVQRNEYPARKTRTEFQDEGDVVIVIDHYLQLVQYVWHNFRCVNGLWTKQSVVMENTTRTFIVRYEAV